uniref:Uncharacterized protein n=1 Tax=Magnetospirillum gryphiswaldense TaxID=55518 RepID=A4TW79_9PROT|nr:hypothetical protein MGR_1762 [Magnetospirillum gryphiswaldense MSR-1]
MNVHGFTLPCRDPAPFSPQGPSGATPRNSTKGRPRPAPSVDG